MHAATVLERRIGLPGATALLISNVIGVGIFTTPGVVARLVPRPGAIMAVWLVGGLLAFAGAQAYAEMATLLPHAGGEYVYLRTAFGPLAGFLSGWTSFIAGFSGAIAAGAIGLATYLGRFFPAAADARPLAHLSLIVVKLELSPRSILAIGVILLVSLIHIRGVGLGSAVQNTLAALGVVALIALITAGFASGRGSFQTPGQPGPAVGGGFLLALVPVMFTYSGWNATTYVAEEVRRPERNLLRAVITGSGVVVVLYLALNLLYLFALPARKLAGVINAGDATANALFGPIGARVVSALIVLALAGGISAMVVAGPRVYFAMARDGVFPPALASVHRRFRTPAFAIAAQALWSAVLVLSGSFEQLLLYTGFAVVLFSALAVLSLFFLRPRSVAVRTARNSISSAAAAVFVGAMLAIAADLIAQRPATALPGLALIAAGIPVYWRYRRRTGIAAPVTSVPPSQVA